MYQLKAKPEDFKVKENLNVKLKEKGNFLYFILKKTNWTTLKAIDEISRRLNIPKENFSTAGMKDKEGVTEQYVSVYGVKEIDLKKLKIKDIQIKVLGYSDFKINLGQLESNSFEITVRNLEKPLKKIEYFPNYYDTQRFGGIRPNTHLVGKKFLEKDFEGAMKIYLGNPFKTETEDFIDFRKKIDKNWPNISNLEPPKGMFFEKKVINSLKNNNYLKAFQTLPRQLLTLFVQAYQSKLFNDCLGEYVKKNKDVKLEIPIIGYDLKESNDEVNNIIQEIMKKENIKPEDFKSNYDFINSRSILRNAFTKLEDLQLSDLQPDELNKGKFKQLIKFKLNKGSYATMAIKAMYHNKLYI